MKGQAITQCRARHRHQEFLDFLREIDTAVPPELDVTDSYASHNFVAHYNENCKPFTWTASADSILEKLARLSGRIKTGH
jgi:hypothetical protein